LRSRRSPLQHHLHLYTETAELRKRVELAVWEIHIETRRISVPDMKH
jgi:hypothetical protein